LSTNSAFVKSSVQSNITKGNLLANAVRYSRANGTIRINCRKDSEDYEQKLMTLKFSVEDNGVGIPEEEAGNLFRAFSQSSNQPPGEESKTGTGLGLAICKKLVNLMGGEIWFESKLGEVTNPSDDSLGKQVLLYRQVVIGPKCISAKARILYHQQGRSTQLERVSELSPRLPQHQHDPLHSERCHAKLPQLKALPTRTVPVSHAN
jgi:signal transduction histidine kinase